DLWSVGAILFHALTGRRPFLGDSLGRIILSVCSDPLPVASQVAPELPKAVDTFFSRALARSPERRFQSARELALAFEAVAAESALQGASASASVPATLAPALT